MVKSPEAEYDHGKLLERCRNWWMHKSEKGLLQMDVHLTRERQEPRTTHSTDYLREWLRTRIIAEKAFQRYRPGHDQPTLHRWLVRKEG